MEYKRIFVISTILLGSLASLSVHADTLGQSVSFFTNTSYDYSGRTQVTATLYAASTYADYYVEDSYWSNLGVSERTSFTNTLNQVAQAFDNNIYPKETALWGSVGALNTSSDSKVTILLEHLTTSTGGYFDSVNEYPVQTVPTSNHRLMIIVNADSLNNSPRTVESLIAHEFQHLISFNQKRLLRSVDEDTWLNELRSEYSTDFVGYNEPFQDSSLQRRVTEFLTNPSDSLTEWLNKPFEYGAVALFGKYMVEQYGTDILKETLQTSKVGIDSINDYLAKHGYQRTFKDLFKNWVITNYLNSATDTYYNYHQQDLKNFHVIPVINNLYYPFSYTYNYPLKPWQPAWYKFNINSPVPAAKIIKLEFQDSVNFNMVYVDDLGQRELTSPTYLTSLPSSFVLIPYNKSKSNSFTGNDPPANLTINLSFVDIASISTAVSDPSSIPDGALIKKIGGTNLYVVTGPYKRYMSPEAISLYGHLVPNKAVEVTPEVFDSFPTSNYVRIVNTTGVYAVWPDNTKHLFKISFNKSGRDPRLIFTINPLEFNIYKPGVPILR